MSPEHRKERGRTMALPRAAKMPKDVVSELLDGEGVVLSLTTGKYYALNGTAARAWQLIEKPGD